MRADLLQRMVQGAVLLLCALLSAAGQARAEDESQAMSIVVSPSFEHEVDEAQLKDVFTGARQRWKDGTKVQVIDQPENETGALFYKRFTGKPVRSIRLRWMKLVLSGQIPAPRKCGDDACVREAVGASPNAVGFVRASAVDSTVREVLRVRAAE